MAQIERKDAMNMVSIMCAGLFANPASISWPNDTYLRQQKIQQMIWDAQDALSAAGITISDEES